MRLSQVGKEQAVQKEAAHIAQSAQGNELVKRSQEQARSVNESRELEDGAEAIKEDEQKNRNAGEEGTPQEKRKKERSEKRNVFRDPNLGNKIDING